MNYFHDIQIWYKLLYSRECKRISEVFGKAIMKFTLEAESIVVKELDKLYGQ
jgi:hypothetical protein